MNEVKDLDLPITAEGFTGFVTNESNQAYFTLQRQIPPGGKIKLSEAYLAVGHKSGETDELAFAQWLQEHVLQRGSWGYYDQEENPLMAKETIEAVVEEKIVEVEKKTEFKTSSSRERDARGAGRALRRNLEDAKGVVITPKAIIEAPYEEARALIEKSKDRVVLKKALALTQHFSHKEKHMRHLIRRIEQVY
jgi:hypothetical protein